MLIELVSHSQLDTAYDPTDTDNNAQLAHAALDLLDSVLSILRDDSNGLRLGRDQRIEAAVRTRAVAECLGLRAKQVVEED